VATLNEVDIQLRAQGENEATAALKRFQNASKQLSTSVIDSGRKIESINSRWKEAERLQQKNVISAKALRAAQTQLAREYAVLNGMTETYVRNGREYSRVATNQAKATLVTKAATEQAAAAQAQYAQRMEQLRVRLDPVYRASQQYKQSLRELIQFQRAGGITMDEYRKRVVQLKEEFGKVSQGGRGARRSMNNFNMGIQQAGFQVSDFAIQVQSGQSAFVAFSQQASQLVGILPLMAENIGLTAGKAIALSAGLGVAIPLVTVVAGALFNLGKEAKDSSEKVETLESKLKSLDRTLQDWIRTKEAASLGITAEELLGIKGIDKAEEDLRDARKALDELTETVKSPGFGAAGGISLDFFKGFFDADTVSKYENSVKDVIEAETRLATLRRKQGEEQFSTFAEQKRQLDQQLALSQEILVFGRESARVKNLELRQEIANRKRSIDQQVESNELTIAQGVALKNLVERTLRAGDAADEFKDTIDSTNISSLAAQAGLLASNMGIAASEAAKYNSALNRQAGIEEKSGVLSFGLPGMDAGRQTGTGFSRLGFGNLDEPPTRTLIPQSTPSGGSAGGAGGGSGRADTQEYIAGLEQEARFKRTLVGLSDEQVKTEERRQSIVEKLTQDGENLTETESKRVEKLLETEAQTRRLMEAEEQRQAMMDQVEGHMKNALMSVVDGSKSVEDAFRSMMRNILLAVYEQQVAQPAAEGIGNLISTGISSLFPSAKGNVFSGGDRVTAYADGGVVDRPTMFPMRGGTGLMSEAGPEAIMPLKRGKGGKLGVASEGGGSLTVNVVMDPSTGALGAFVQDQAGQVVAKAAPQLAQYANKTMVDQRRRGGSMKATFRG